MYTIFYAQSNLTETVKRIDIDINIDINLPIKALHYSFILFFKQLLSLTENISVNVSNRIN